MNAEGKEMTKAWQTEAWPMAGVVYGGLGLWRAWAMAVSAGSTWRCRPNVKRGEAA